MISYTLTPRAMKYLAESSAAEIGARLGLRLTIDQENMMTAIILRQIYAASDSYTLDISTRQRNAEEIARNDGEVAK